jgi:hypothetical protein
VWFNPLLALFFFAHFLHPPKTLSEISSLTYAP